MDRIRLIASIATLVICASASPSAAAEPEPVPCDGCYVPPIDVDWQYQLSSAPDPATPYDLWLIDMFDNESSLVQELHDTGGYVGCYISAGSWEKWRPDADDFPKSVLGKALDGWPGERWLDIRKLDVLQPLLTARIEECVARGFDAVDFDNVNGYQNRTGFRLKWRHQLAFNRWLANAAHEHGLAVGLKNDGPQVEQLVDYFDFSIVESCFEYKECGQYKPFIDAGKPVLEVEYSLPLSEFCPKAIELGFRSLKKKLLLGAWRRAC